MTVLSVMTLSCSDKDVYDPDFEKNAKLAMPANTFDFSTVQEVNLTVDYSAFNLYGPVRFSIYNENPLIVGEDDEVLRESIRPVYENYTDANGKFSMDIQLPAYAKHLYVVTGNYFVTQRLMETDVVNGVARAVAYPEATRAFTRATDTSAGSGGSAQKPMEHLWYTVNEKGDTVKRIFNDWLTPLGTWNTSSGRPNYLSNSSVNSDLLFTSTEMVELYKTINDVLDAYTPPVNFINSADLTLAEDAEVAITMLGGSTCWNSTLGYYYYTKTPTKPSDVHVIMLYPNTQDGNWTKLGLHPTWSFGNNIGVKPGDAVQLIYYPHIASGDMSEPSKIFPKDTKIGFVLKSNGWGMQGKNYALNGYSDGKRKYNVWAATTKNVSYCEPLGKMPGEDPYQIVNPAGDSRAAKFSCTSSSGKQYAIISFEDACNDQDYDDVIFAVKSYESFKPMPPAPELQKVSTHGVYGFEDLWPNQGDYDMNDIVVDFEHEKVMKKDIIENVYKVFKENFYLTTYQNYVTLKSGLALTLKTKVNPSKISMRKIDPRTHKETDIDVYKNRDDKVFYFTDDVKAQLGTTYVLTLDYDDSRSFTDDNKQATVYPFIYRNEEDKTTWEVHIPGEAPTSKMNKEKYFGKGADRSHADGPYYVGGIDNCFPFAFFLSGCTVEDIHAIVERPYESLRIDELFGDFIEWSKSNGSRKTDWYLNMSRKK